ncbi:MAG: hypothetical protein R2939_09740 [Kofleriaceae bacterium]
MRGVVVWALVAIGGGACGRRGFEPDAGDASIDAVGPRDGATTPDGAPPDAGPSLCGVATTASLPGVELRSDQTLSIVAPSPDELWIALANSGPAMPTFETRCCRARHHLDHAGGARLPVDGVPEPDRAGAVADHRRRQRRRDLE